MKLTDFKNINEFNVRGVNNYGSAALQRKANQKAGNADAGLSTKETLGKNIFVDKFVQKASAGIENAVRSGAISATEQPAQTTPTNTTLSPEQIRKQKQAAAIKAINNPPKPTPTGTAMPTKPYQVPGVGTDPKQQPTQQAKTATTGTAMPTKPYQVPGASTNPNPTQAAPAQPKPKQFTATKGPNPEDYAKFDKLIKAKAAAQKESRYSKMNAIFENILNEQSPTIASFVVDAWKAYLHGVTPSPQKLQQAQQLANQVQATYAKDKGQAALRQLGDLAWYASTESAGTPVDQEDGDYASTDNTQAQDAAIAGNGSMRQVYAQVTKLLQTLDKRDRAQVIAAIQSSEEKASI